MLLDDRVYGITARFVQVSVFSSSSTNNLEPRVLRLSGEEPENSGLEIEGLNEGGGGGGGLFDG